MSSFTCKQYDIGGGELDKLEIPFTEVSSVNNQMIRNYVTAVRRNARQWSANTKGRKESNHSGAKPHPQKGTGRARQGFLGSPQYKGGGRVFTPKPKFNQHVRTNKKERQAILKSLLIEKGQQGNIQFICLDPQKEFTEPKTKRMKALLTQMGWENDKVLCIREKNGEFLPVHFSLKNIPRVSSILLDHMNGYTLLAHTRVLMFNSMQDSLKELLK